MLMCDGSVIEFGVVRAHIEKQPRASMPRMFGQFARLREEDMTLVIVDQMADHVLPIADRGYVIGGGRIVAEGKATELRGTILDETYLGAHPAAVN